MITKNLRSMLSVLTANIFILLTGLITSFLIPFLMEVSDYGYYQTFVFYSGYLGLTLLGFPDGVNIMYLGKNYEGSSIKDFRLFLLISLLLGTLSAFFVLFMSTFLESQQQIIFIFLSINIIIFSVNSLLTHINQITMRFKQYSLSGVIERFSFIVFSLFFLIAGSRRFVFVILSFTLARIVVLCYNIYSSKEVFFGIKSKFSDMSEIIKTVFKKGFIVMIATLLLLILNNSNKFLIDIFLTIEDFALYSFANSSLGLVLQMITAISVVFYPLMKNMSDSNRINTINLLDRSITNFTLLMYLSFFPLQTIISVLLSKYSRSLEFLPFLFPMILMYSKTNFININFLRINKNHIKMLLYNFLGVIWVFFVSYIVISSTRNLILLVLFSTLAYFLWYLVINMLILNKNIFEGTYTHDFIMSILFILSTIFDKPLFGFLFYLFVLLIYYLVNHRLIILDINEIKKKSFKPKAK